MADYNKFERRIDSLVMETRTQFAADVIGLSADDEKWVSHAVHAQPQLAAQVSYERSHTGFIREIVVTGADIARIYESHAR